MESYSDKFKAYTSPSQVITIPTWIAAIAAAIFFEMWFLALIPIVRMIEIYYWRYEFHERSVLERKGVFSVIRKELLYHRIKSLSVEEPFWLRIFGLGNVTIKSSDPFMPDLQLYAIPKPNRIREILRELTNKYRKEEGSKEFDIYNLNK
jgi:membrane protein YdbS with pleckstrin-like domain